MSSDFALALAARARALGIDLPSRVIASLETYFGLLLKWNRTVNLTSLPVESGGDEALDRLLLEPIAAASYFPSDVSSWVDLGSGGGSPAVPLKIVRPDATLVMVESRSRKVAFLREVVRALGLADVRVEADRFEALAESTRLAATADVVTARAVRPDAAFAHAVQAVLRMEGQLLLFGSSGRGAVELAGLDLTLTTSLSTPNSRLTIYRRRG